jgi:RNA polymerase sigma-70 factor (ECF subfamily)
VNNKEAKFSELYKDHFNKVFKLCLKSVKNVDIAMDITQEAFARAYEHYDSLREEGAFLSWVQTIAMNHLRNLITRDLNRYMPLDEYLQHEYLSERGVEDCALDAMADLEIRCMLATLPLNIQQILWLRYYYQFTEMEISKIMEVPVGTVKSRLYRSRKKIEKLILSDNLNIDSNKE